MREPYHPWQDRSKQTVLRDGKTSIAVAIMANGHAIAALNVTWPSKRVHVEDVVSRHLETLQGIADRIGQAVESN